MVAPYFADGPLGAAARAFSLEQWPAAQAGFSAAASDATLDPKLRARARFLASLAAAEAGDWKTAQAGFEAVLPELGALADYIHYQAARAAYFAGDLAAAKTHAEAVPETSIAKTDATLLIGDILRAGNDPAAVAAHYTAYIAAHPDGPRLTEARYRVAEANEAEGQAADALIIYRRITIADPLSDWALMAGERIAALTSGGKLAEKPLSAAEHITRGMALYAAMHNPESAAEYAAALAVPDLSAATRCMAAFYLAQSWYKERDRQKAAPLFDAAMAACKAANNADLFVKAAYQAGRAYSFFDDEETAIARFATVEKTHPEHSFADDARLRRAAEYVDLGDEAMAEKLIATTPSRYPDGDMRGEAMWRLAWRAYKAKDYAAAETWLKKQIALRPHGLHFWTDGQARYWLGRVYGKLGHSGPAMAAYEKVIWGHPMSFYALLSLNRMREEDPARFARIKKAIAAPPAGIDLAALALNFRPRPIYRDPGFLRALEYLRLGLGQPAAAELSRIGFVPPGGRDPVTDADLSDKLWAMAFLYHHAGQFSDSHWVTRWHLVDYQRAWPVAGNRDKWEIAYPHAWWDLIQRQAKAQGVSPRLTLAFVREESAFNPLAESYANAVGLMQLIMPTARRFAEGTGIAVSRETLRVPENNITIGTHFLAYLKGRFSGFEAMMVPSYNAGAGATTRWLRERGDWATDEFLEEIPYEQTNRYTKRVLQAYFAYSYLYGGVIPQIPNTIPKAIVPAPGK